MQLSLSIHSLLIQGLTLISHWLIHTLSLSLIFRSSPSTPHARLTKSKRKRRKSRRRTKIKRKEEKRRPIIALVVILLTRNARSTMRCRLQRLREPMLPRTPPSLPSMSPLLPVCETQVTSCYLDRGIALIFILIEP